MLGTRGQLWVLGVLFGTIAALPAAAEEAPWPEVRGKKIACFADHFHFGSSKNEPSRKAAEAMAGKSWAEFVAWEYGDGYADWRIAASKEIDCGKDDATQWSCTVSARPCRRLRK